ncbi:MoaD/ThiS family protein [Candidatus Woesearchaeota archaeon]|nr:MoaD/ThiS family protein [Candidatus Woesearchaeota archaeon]
MNITVIHERKQATEHREFAGKTVFDLLQQLRVSPEAVIVVRNNNVLTENEILKDNDEIQLLSVISGG